MGLAVYNSIALDIHFPLCCYRWVGSSSVRLQLLFFCINVSFLDPYRKLLMPPTAPLDQIALVGMAAATLDDLQQIMPVCLVPPVEGSRVQLYLQTDGSQAEDLLMTTFINAFTGRTVRFSSSSWVNAAKRSHMCSRVSGDWCQSHQDTEGIYNRPLVT